MRSFRFGRVFVGAALAIALVSGPSARADDSKPASSGGAGVGQYLPDGTLLVISLNLKQLLEAPLIKGDEKAFKQGMAEMSKVLEGFGIDPKKDLSRVVLAGGMEAQKSVLVLLEGKFDSTKLAAKLKELAADQKNNLTIVNGDKSTHYKVSIPKQALPQPGMPNEFVFAQLDDNFIAVALDKEALSTAVGRKRGAKKPDVTPEVMELIGKINPKETLSLVVVPPQSILAGSPVDGLKTVTGGVTVADGVKTDIIIATKDGDTAKNLAQMINEGLNQIKGLLPIVAAQQPGFGPKEQKMVQDLMDTFKAVSGDGGVKLQSNISKEFIEKNGKKDQ